MAAGPDHFSLAAAAADGRSVKRNARPGRRVGKPTYYNRSADWYANPDFCERLTAVTELKAPSKNAAARED